jgi:hypothetical protein
VTVSLDASLRVWPNALAASNTGSAGAVEHELVLALRAPVLCVAIGNVLDGKRAEQLEVAVGGLLNGQIVVIDLATGMLTEPALDTADTPIRGVVGQQLINIGCYCW